MVRALCSMLKFKFLILSENNYLLFSPIREERHSSFSLWVFKIRIMNLCGLRFRTLELWILNITTLVFVDIKKDFSFVLI